MLGVGERAWGWAQQPSNTAINLLHTSASTHRRQVKHGEGALALPDGSVYEGEFTEGEITGRGRRTYPGGMRYEGDLFRGEKHGQGKLRYADGSEYDGGWVEQRRQGSGKLVSAVNGQLNVYVASVACVP